MHGNGNPDVVLPPPPPIGDGFNRVFRRPPSHTIPGALCRVHTTVVHSRVPVSRVLSLSGSLTTTWRPHRSLTASRLRGPRCHPSLPSRSTQLHRQFPQKHQHFTKILLLRVSHPDLSSDLYHLLQKAHMRKHLSRRRKHL